MSTRSGFILVACCLTLLGCSSGNGNDGGACFAGETACSGTCVNLQTDRSHCGLCTTVCAGGMTCVEGRCQPECPDSQTACGNLCADLQTDRTNCGACGTACTPGMVCSAGHCARECTSGLAPCPITGDGGVMEILCSNTRTDRLHCGSCDRTCAPGEQCADSRCTLVCPEGQMACSGACTDVSTDRANCGSCRTACGATYICVGGRCTFSMCPMGTTSCSGACVDTMSDQNHCGMCGRVCAAGQLCTMGTCTQVCAMGQTLCSGRCVDTQTEQTHCGMCGNACPVGRVCLMGTCTQVCAMGQMLCSGRCVDLSTDRAHCGACGTACTGSSICSGGACTMGCPTGLTECSSTCVNINVDPANCATCGHACATGEACVSGTCTAFGMVDGGCAPPSTMCGPVCTDTRSDNLHCGSCGHPCSADRACITGTCATLCAAGEDRCGTSCTRIMSDRLNCGRCGNVCGTGLSCAGGMCVTEPSFRIATLGTTGCRNYEHASTTGDDHGGIAVSPTTLFYTGDTSTGRWSATDLSGGSGTAVGVVHDALCGDLATGAVYVLLNSSGTEISGGTGSVTQLGVLDPSLGTLTPTRIPLSMPITLAYSSGIFSGYGRMLIHNNTQWFHIRLPSGEVTALRSATTPTHTSCETWAYWGIAEYVGGEYFAVYVESGTRIARYRVSDGMITTAATFSSLSDMCSITFSPLRNRWYWHHEGGSQFGGSDENIGYCDGTFETP